MSSETAPVEQDQKASGEPSKEDKVAYATYQKVLGEKKRKDQELEQALNKLKEFEQKDLEAKGKDKELIEALRKEKAITEEKLMKTVQTFANKSVSQQIANEAIKHGCVDTDLLMKAIDSKAMQFDEETFSVNPEDLKREVEKVMKAKPFLFNKSGPKVHDMPLTSQGPGMVAEKKKLTIDEMAKIAASLGNQKQ